MEEKLHEIEQQLIQFKTNQPATSDSLRFYPVVAIMELEGYDPEKHDGGSLLYQVINTSKNDCIIWGTSGTASNDTGFSMVKGTPPEAGTWDTFQYTFSRNSLVDNNKVRLTAIATQPCYIEIIQTKYKDYIPPTPADK